MLVQRVRLACCLKLNFKPADASGAIARRDTAATLLIGWLTLSTDFKENDRARALRAHGFLATERS